MDSNIIIRRARTSDAEAILEYLKRVGGESDNLTFGAEGIPVTVEQEKAFLESWSSSEQRSLLLVAVRTDENGREQIVADASLTAMSRRLAHRAELGISVVKSEWGKGIGTRMIEKMIDHAKMHGIELIYLEVRTDNERAIRLYERMGFKRIGVSPAYMKIDGQYFDVLLMYLDLR